MTSPSTINFTTNPIQGQLQFNALAVENMTLAAVTSNQLVPLPIGLTTATFVAVKATAIADLHIQLSTASGATALVVPFQQTLLVYGATAVYVSSVAGGTIQLVVG